MDRARRVDEARADDREMRGDRAEGLKHERLGSLARGDEQARVADPGAVGLDALGRRRRAEQDGGVGPGHIEPLVVEPHV